MVERIYSADEAPRLPELKLSMKRTTLLSRGTAVPPDCREKVTKTQSINALIMLSHQGVGSNPGRDTCVLEQETLP